MEKFKIVKEENTRGDYTCDECGIIGAQNFCSIAVANHSPVWLCEDCVCELLTEIYTVLGDM